MFDELLATEGVTEHCEIRNDSMGFLAIHGGLEAMTFEIASAAALRSGASLYAVVQPDSLQWHVPSHKYVQQDSRQLSAFSGHVNCAISLHGYGGVRDSQDRWTTVLLGGSNRDVAHDLGEQLNAAFDGYYQFISDIEAIPAAYRGIHPRNPVNQPRCGGVQIELPPRIRGSSPLWAEAPRNAQGFVAHTELLVATLARYAST